MNRKIRIAGFLIALMSVGGYCHAQHPHTLTFAYDLDGNRTNREILFERLEKKDEVSGELLASVTDLLGPIELSLYPNPTNEKFFVEIKGEKNKKAEAILTNLSGAALEERVLTSSVESFDLSELAPGMYLLKIVVDSEAHVWKVIKK